MLFVIGRCICNIKYINLTFESYTSVRRFYPHSKIMIVDDNSQIIDPNVYDDNVIFVKNEFPKSGEIGLYYYYFKYIESLLDSKNSDNYEDFKAFIMHDSMSLNNVILETEDDVKFLWYFPNHAYDDPHHIHYLLNFLKNKESLVEHYTSTEWLGCFGVTSIISYNFLNRINEKYGFLNLIEIIKNRDHRCALERVFATICFKELGSVDNVCGNIFNHPGAFLSDYQFNKSKYTGPILKKWCGR